MNDSTLFEWQRQSLQGRVRPGREAGMEFPQAQPHPCSPFVNLTSPWNCLGLVPWVWILLQTHFPARQILGRVSSTLQALSAAKLNLAFQIFFFFPSQS